MVAGTSGKRCRRSESAQGAMTMFSTTLTPLRGVVRLSGARE